MIWNMNTEIRKYRQSKNWTQTDLGLRLGIGQGAISNIERGIRAISKTVALRLNALDPGRFPLGRLLGAEPPMDTPQGARPGTDTGRRGRLSHGPGRQEIAGPAEQEEAA